MKDRASPRRIIVGMFAHDEMTERRHHREADTRQSRLARSRGRMAHRRADMFAVTEDEPRREELTVTTESLRL